MALSHALAALQRRFSGIFGLAARDLQSGREIKRNAGSVFPAASTIKIPIMVEIFRRVDAGQIDLDAPLPYVAEHTVEGTGVLKNLTPGLSLSVRDLVTLMIIVSDNVATNMLIDALGGVAPVNDTMTALGFPELVVHRRISFTSPGKFAEGTPQAFCDLLTAIARGKVVSPTASRGIIDVMKRQQYTDIIGRYLLFDTMAHAKDPAHHLGIATKHGSLQGVRNDVGLVFPPGREPYVIALMSKDCKDTRYWAENEASVTLGKVSELVYNAFVGGGDSPRTPPCN